jgi:hypothetical protein
LSRDTVFPISLASENQPGAPAQLDDGRLAFAMSNVSGTNYLERGLYALALDTFVPRKLIGLPPASQDQGQTVGFQIFWAPDGSGAILHDDLSNWLVCASIQANALYDLQSIISPAACCFTWTK